MRNEKAAEMASLAGAVALGGFLRFGWPGVSPFAYDEARLSYLALSLARHGRIPLTGMVSSVGAPNMPASVWIFAIPYALSTNPMLAVAFVGALNLIAVLALWWMARRMWGPWAGVTAAWLLAGSPYAAFYSRSVWAQDLLIPLSVLWAASTLMTLEKKDRRWAVVAGFLAGLTVQVHYAGFVLPLLALFLLLLHRRFREILPLTCGIVISAATAVPFLAGLLQGDIRLTAGNGGIGVGIASLRHIVALASGYDWGWLLLGNGWALSRGSVALAAGIVLALASAVGIALLLGYRREGRGIPTSLVLLWALAGPLIWTVHFTKPNLHYQLVALPAWFLAAGFVVSALPKRWLRAAALFVVVAATLAQGAIFAAGIATAGRKATPGGIGAPLKYHLKAVSAARDGNPVIAIVPGEDPQTDGDAAILDVLLWGYPHRLVDGRHALLMPSRPSNLLFVAPWLPAWSEFSRSVAGWDGVRYLPRREGEYPYLLVRLSGNEEPVGFRKTGPVTLSNGASLEGWKVRWSVGGGFRFVTLWSIACTAQGEDYHQFNHLYVGNARKPTIGRDGPVSSRSWEAGDRLITWADFPPPPGGKLTIGVGMYSYPSLKRVPLERTAQPLAPIMLGPLR